ncbi:unnamed protein product, partial [Ilex paraguariensis]
SSESMPRNVLPPKGSLVRLKKTPPTPKVKIDLETSREKRVSLPSIPRANPRDWTREQV